MVMYINNKQFLGPLFGCRFLRKQWIYPIFKIIISFIFFLTFDLYSFVDNTFPQVNSSVNITNEFVINFDAKNYSFPFYVSVYVLRNLFQLVVLYIDSIFNKLFNLIHRFIIIL